MTRRVALPRVTNREQAAKALGISRRALQYKLKKYGLLNVEPSAAAIGRLTDKAQLDQDSPSI